MNIFTFLSLRYFIIGYAAIFLFIFSPFVFVLFANVMAEIADCPKGVAFSNEVCTNGDILYALSQAGWLLVFTLPIGLVLLGALGVVNALVYLLLKKRAALALFVFEQIRRRLRK